MNIFKITLTMLVGFSASVVFGQSTPSTIHKEEPSRNIKKHQELIEVKQLYFEDTHILESYFVKNEVKNGFPGYNYHISKSQNALEIKKWLMIKENKESLTSEGLKSIELYIKSK